MSARDELRRLLELAVWSHADADKAVELARRIFAAQLVQEWQGVGMSDRYEAAAANDGDESGW